jgi:hypothetical protein
LSVAAVARTADDVTRAVQGLQRGGPKAHRVVSGSTDARALASVVEKVTRVLEAPRPDILMAFAGGFHKTTPILQLSEEEWLQVVE